MTHKIIITSKHDVYGELMECTGEREYNQFVATMSNADLTKLTLQCMENQSNYESVSEGNAFMRVAERARWVKDKL